MDTQNNGERKREREREREREMNKRNKRYFVNRTVNDTLTLAKKPYPLIATANSLCLVSGLSISVRNRLMKS